MRPKAGCRRSSGLALAASAGIAVFGAVAGQAGLSSPPVERIDVNDAGEPADAIGLAPSTSGNGRYIAFISAARNLAQGDTNGQDVFVRDLQTGTTTLASVATGGIPANGESAGANISTDARFVAFNSRASNLVPEDTNNAADIFVHDRAVGETTRASVGTGGAQLSGGTGLPSDLSAGGRYVAFLSASPNVVPGYVPRSVALYVHDRVTKRTTLATPRRWRPSLIHSVSVSADGRRVAFARLQRKPSTRSVFVSDRDTERTIRVHTAASPTSRSNDVIIAEGTGSQAAISGNGRYVAFVSPTDGLVPDDHNGGADVFVRDLKKDTVARVSLRPDNTPVRRCRRTDNAGTVVVRPCGASPAISHTGRFIAFHTDSRRFDPSRAGNSSGIYLRDMRLRRTRPVTRPAVPSHISISGDGRLIAFGHNGGVFAIR